MRPSPANVAGVNADLIAKPSVRSPQTLRGNIGFWRKLADRLVLTLRVCVVYDCLFPYTVGGAERWYRNLSERLAGDGHEVTYLTLRQWAPGEEPEIDGVRVLAVGPRMPMYAGGRRRVLPPVVFGLGVLRHLVAHGRTY